MQGSKQDIEIDQPITYSLASDTFNKCLKIYNRSNSIYVFKVKTNQRSVISMQLTHDFVLANSSKEIVIKLAEKPSETTPLKLQLNYAIPSEQEIRLNDSKMNSYTRDNVFKKIVTVVRDDSVNPISPATVSTSEKIKVASPQAEEKSTRFVSQQYKIQPKKQEKSTVIVQKKQEKKAQKVQKLLKKQEKREQSKQNKVQKEVYSQQIKYPSASYVPTQVKSEQINILSGRSAQINISDLVIEAPVSSQQAIKAYQQPIQVPKPVKREDYRRQSPSIIVEPEKNEDYSYANSSPANKKNLAFGSNNNNFSSQEDVLKSLSSKIQNEKITIHKLKSEYIEELKSDCVYPVPILYLIVLLSFLSGSLVNWIAS